MGNTTSKELAKLDYDQVIRATYNPDDKSVTTSSFVDAKVGHKILRNAIDSVTDEYSYYDDTTLLKTIRIVYTSAAHTDIVSVERIA